ncbi:hypothetical protein CLOL250_02651 [Clostridium sp. L2-50]|nr:hypothetical protein CLOL250_02651 [Clostridium sp. L2-50]
MKLSRSCYDFTDMPLFYIQMCFLLYRVMISFCNGNSNE